MLLRTPGSHAKSIEEVAEDLMSLEPEARGQKLEAVLSIDRLQFFPRLEAHSFAGRDRHFGAGARVASDASLARTHVEHAKPTQLNAITVGQRLLHALKDGFHRQLGLGLGDAGSGHHFVDDVELNHTRLPDAVSGRSLK